jgi:hypothetical protein
MIESVTPSKCHSHSWHDTCRLGGSGYHSRLPKRFTEPIAKRLEGVDMSKTLIHIKEEDHRPKRSGVAVAAMHRKAGKMRSKQDRRANDARRKREWFDGN